jgi:hypothetical protein
MTWRASTRAEIQQYYRDEFHTYLGDLPEYITPYGPKEFALAFREEYPSKGQGTRDFIRRSTWVTDDEGDKQHPQFDEWPALLSFFRAPADEDPLRAHADGNGLADPDALSNTQRPVPEAVYYGVDHWERNWLLPVDIDAKDVAYERALRDVTPRDGENRESVLQRAGIVDAPPEGFKYGFEDIRQALVYAFAVKDLFEDLLEASETQVFYSGQGAHIYLQDDDPAHRYDQRAREVIVAFLEDEFDIPIDAVVTADEARVMRLPYSLHADVSRLVMPVEDASVDFWEISRPDFLGEDERADAAAERAGVTHQSQPEL